MRLLSKIIISYLMNYYKIWIARYKIIYKKFSDRVEIEEKVELMNNLRAVLDNGNNNLLLQ